MHSVLVCVCVCIYIRTYACMHVFRFSLILSLSLSLSRAHHQLMKFLRARTRTQMDTDLNQVVDVLKEYHDNLGAEGNGNPRTHTLAAVARAPSLFLQRSLTYARTLSLTRTHFLTHVSSWKRMAGETGGETLNMKEITGDLVEILQDLAATF